MRTTKTIWNKVSCGALAVVLAFASAAVIDAAEEGLCPHRNHDGDCGFQQAVVGADCRHNHDASCYSLVLICGEEEAAAPSTDSLLLCSEAHTHTAFCYGPVCGFAEHGHDPSCYGLCCGQEAHSHGDACSILVCGNFEPGHTHETSCYHSVCGQEAHSHGDACYALICGTAAHGHRADCYALPTAPAGHSHSDACYQDVLSCQHVHDQFCGYVAAVAGRACSHSCPACHPQAFDTGWEERDEEEEMIIPGAVIEPVLGLETSQLPPFAETPVQEVAAAAQPQATDAKTEWVHFPNGIQAKGSDATIALAPEEIAEILTELTGISSARQAVVLQAQSLVGHVGYFWGGKSTAIGWDKRWGNATYVTSPHSESTGTLRPFGLDCSGFLTWAFLNAAGEGGLAALNTETVNLWQSGSQIPWEDAQPGDVAYQYAPGSSQDNHMGILVGKDETGAWLVAHCASAYNNVVVTAAADSGFSLVIAPDIYQNEAFLRQARRVLSGEDYYGVYQWVNSQEIPEEEARLGDHAFTAPPDSSLWQAEVGIVCGRDETGALRIAYPTEDGTEIAPLSETRFTCIRRVLLP